MTGHFFNGSQCSLRCPRCTGELVGCGADLRCATCNAKFEVRDGIVDLRCGRFDYYFNPVPPEAMNELIEDAQRESWSSIVRRFMAHVKDNPDWLDDLVIDSRYAWKFCLDLPPDGRFLDLGCGLGNLVKNIAPHVGETVALDLTWERLRFAKRRFERFNADDRIVMVAGGDGKYLPFPDRYFDAVSLSGVLEWVADVENWRGPGSKLSKAWQMAASFFGESNPRRMQKRFLQEIRRILKPEGQIFVAIENRLNYEYFGQRPDHHTLLWYGSLLPRFAANLYSIAVNRHPYRTYTYSMAGLRRLFRAAGFPRQQFLGFLDGYTHLSEIVPLQTASDVIWQRHRQQAFRDRVKRSDYFVPAYGVIGAGEANTANPFLTRIAAEIGQRLPGQDSSVQIESFHVTGKEKAVMRGTVGGQPVMINIPCNAAALAAQERHYAFLERALGLPDLAGVVPRPMVRGRLQNASYYVESVVTGKPMREEIVRRGRTFMLPEVSKLLRAMNSDPSSLDRTTLAGEEFERLVERPSRKILEVLDDPELAKEIKARLFERLHGMPIRCGLLHGDFSVHNIFAHDGRVSGLIDWEDVHSAGLPILDALNYLESVQRAFNPGLTLADTIPLLATANWPVDEERRFLAESYEYLGFDQGLQLELAILYWLYHVGPQLEYSLACNRREIKQRIELVARRFLALV